MGLLRNMPGGLLRRDPPDHQQKGTLLPSTSPEYLQLLFVLFVQRQLHKMKSQWESHFHLSLSILQLQNNLTDFD
jgi:hypothetical protein